MPVTVELPAAALDRPAAERRARPGAMRDRGRRLCIGFVNNMPDAAFAATERQFLRLLEAASGDLDIRLIPVALETVVRDDRMRASLPARYRAPRMLRGLGVDALIVTGAEPRARHLRQEPYWDELTQLMDWAQGATLSTLYSCLAAHAAALHLGGVGRRRRDAKLSGLFASTPAARAHELLDGFRDPFVTPHSRWNGLDETEIARAGFVTLTRSPEGGPDVFIRDGGRLDVFVQGHPEYDADTLAREFRRDVLRFVRGAQPEPPRPPENYFAPEIEAKLTQALAERSGDLEALAAAAARGVGPAKWRPAGVRLASNWLAALARRKAALSPPTFASARLHG